VFQASADHDALVTSYRFEVFADGADVDTASPVAATDLGKPAPNGDGDIAVDQTSLFQALPAGPYVATVSAIGSGAPSRSVAIRFTR
jgi:hypothetical protein